MKLYLADGVYVGTQAEAKRLHKDFTQVEVPTDKDGLLVFLNRSYIAACAKPAEDDISDLLGEPDPQRSPILAGLPPEMFRRPADRQCDVEEAIQNAELVELGCYAHNVALRFAELAK